MTDYNDDLKGQYAYCGCANTLKATDNRLSLFRAQREERGFDDTEMWSLDMTIAAFILPRITYFAENYIKNTEGKQAMEHIIAAFTLVASDECCYTKEQYAVIEKGLRLFAEYLPGLWT